MKIRIILILMIVFLYGLSKGADRQMPIIEEIVFEGHNSIPLKGTLYLPQMEVEKIVIMLNSILYTGYGHTDFTQTKDTLSYDRYIIQKLLDHQIGTLLIETKAPEDLRYPQQTHSSYAKDAENALNYLKSQDRFKDTPIGLWGSSAAGFSASVLASHNKNIDFLILVSVPGTNGLELDEYSIRSPVYNNLRLIAITGPLESTLADSTFFYDKKQYPRFDFLSVILGDAFAKINREVILKHENYDSIYSEGGKLFKELWSNNRFKSNIKNSAFGKDIPVLQYMDSIVKCWYAPFSIDMLKWEPESIFPKISCPILMLYGSKDININLDASLQNVESMIKDNKLKNCTVKCYDDLEHSLIPVNEEAIREIPDFVFTDMLNWLDDL